MGLPLSIQAKRLTNMTRPFATLLLLFLFSCNSPEAQLQRVQHVFWEKLARQDLFEVRLKNEVLYWPLPPEAASAQSQKSLAEVLQLEANSIEKDQLSASDQKQLTHVKAALSDYDTQAVSGFFDPSRCSIAPCLEEFSNHPELPLLIERIPAYYCKIEERWQLPDVRLVSKAVDESKTVLDQLKEIEEKSGGALVVQVSAARGAVKDFIGLCQSALLEAGLK